MVNFGAIANPANTARAVSYAGEAVKNAAEMRPVIEAKGYNFTHFLATVHEQVQGMISPGPVTGKVAYAAADLEALQGTTAGTRDTGRAGAYART